MTTYFVRKTSSKWAVFRRNPDGSERVLFFYTTRTEAEKACRDLNAIEKEAERI